MTRDGVIRAARERAELEDLARRVIQSLQHGVKDEDASMRLLI